MESIYNFTVNLKVNRPTCIFHISLLLMTNDLYFCNIILLCNIKRIKKKNLNFIRLVKIITVGPKNRDLGTT